jgi:hypothetical protein
MNPDQEAACEIDSKAYEAMKALVQMFSGPPQPIGKWRWQHRQYDLVRLDDGTIGFVRNAFDAEMDVHRGDGRTVRSGAWGRLSSRTASLFPARQAVAACGRAATGANALPFGCEQEIMRSR